MAVSNRATKLNKLHRVAKKHYQPVMPSGDRTVLEHLLYACCLEDSQFDAADTAFARLQQGFFDWNEVRVTTAVELAEVMDCLADSAAAATRLKKTLHSMFETNYSFDIDTLRKENLGKAVQKIEKYKGISPFVVSYVAQNALGGHSIAVDNSLINLMYTIGVIDEKEAAKGQVPGLERAIPKNKGVEFFSLVHQLAVAYTSSPFNNDVRAILISISADSKDRFPKRTRKKKAAPEPAAKAPAKASATAARTSTKKAAKKKTTTRAAAASKSKATKKPTTKKTTKKKKVTAKKATTRKKPAARKTTRKSPSKRLARKKPR
ncbi:MAG: hypothetical protein ACR2NP_16035 [Pirellulaceae bacterium]